MIKVITRLLPFILLLGIGTFKTQAQYVTIPDPVFVTWLQNNGFATCMSGNQLDTTCPALANVLSLQCYGVAIRDLTGAQYFKNAQELNCYNDSLYSIPVLPPRLQTLTCYSNNLSTLPPFPATLKAIGCWKNRFTTLPTLPDSLTELDCQQNQITVLPALPASLTSLTCYSNQLTALPALPDSLQFLDCHINNISTLPTLPGSLTYLFCQNNQLTSLPALPDSLYQLYCDNNTNLNCLPQIHKIVYLQFSGTGVTCVPNYGTVTNSTPLIAGLPLCQQGNTHGCLSIPVVNAGNNAAICFGAHVTLGGAPTATGGTPAYAYQWAPGTGLSSTTVSNPVASPIATTTYTVTVTDTIGVTATGSVTITVHANPVAAAGPNVTLVTCNQTGVQIGGTPTASGGSGPSYTYSWSPTVGESSNIVANPVISGISTNTTYIVVVTDIAGCSASSSVQVTVISSNLLVGISSSGDTSWCAASETQDNLTALVAGGTAPYLYSWSGSNIFPVNNQGATVNPGIAGHYNYSVTVTDANNCTNTNTITISVIARPTSNFTVTSPVCMGQISTITYTGDGIGGAVYNWDFGNATILSGTGQGPYQVSWNNAGTNSITLSLLQSSCTSDTTVIPVTVNNSSLQLDSIVAHNARCYGDTGALCVYVTGAPPYQYNWSNGEQTNASCLSNLSAATYTVTVFNGSGCSVTGTGTISQPAQLAVSITATNSSCSQNTGSLTATVLGGTPGYAYQWAPAGTTQIISNLAPGVYLLTVTDANGCSATASATVVSPTAIGFDSISRTNIYCYNGNNGSACAHVSGGTHPYFYLWSNSATGQCISGLTAGLYFITVSDVNSCSATDSVLITQPDSLYIQGTVTDITCYGSNDGRINVQPIGGTLPYAYSWNNGVTVLILTQAGGGLYNITVTDGNACTVTAQYIIREPTRLTLNTDSQINVSCLGGANGSICVGLSGGVTPYAYMWSNSWPLSCTTTLSAGNYTVTAVDANGCTAQNSYNITQPASALTLQVSSADSNSIPDLVNVIVSGGVRPYNFNWDDGVLGADSNHTYVTAGIFIDTVTDANGCQVSYRIDAGCNDQCVWPGDANYDGLVDNNDLLPIGLGYDTTGYARLYPTISFTPQYCQNWIDTLVTGVNYKHIDCNGDGIINADDTTAVLLNYGSTHPRGGGAQPWKNNAPILHVKISPDTLSDGQTVTATLSLGDSSLPCTNVYGLAFTYNYDPIVVDTNSINLTFTNSWLAGTGDHINISKNFFGPGQIQAAITRINHLNRSGSGVIANVSMKITTGNINGKNMQYYLMHSFISNLTVIDNAGNVLPFNAGSDTAQVEFIPTAIAPVTAATAKINIFPNPAIDQLYVNCSLPATGLISIVDMEGRTVMQQSIETLTSTLNISALSGGVYMIKVNCNNQEYYSRFVKIGSK